MRGFKTLTAGVVTMAFATAAQSATLAPLVVCEQDLRARDGAKTVIELTETAPGRYTGAVTTTYDVFGAIRTKSTTLSDMTCEKPEVSVDRNMKVQLNKLYCARAADASSERKEWAILRDDRTDAPPDSFEIFETTFPSPPPSQDGREVGIMPQGSSKMLGNKLHLFTCQMNLRTP